MLNNVLFGLGTFAAGGALIGSFLALQRMSFERRGAQRYALWAGVGLVVGLIGGLGAGLDVSAVGGPVRSILCPSRIPTPAAVCADCSSG